VHNKRRGGIIAAFANQTDRLLPVRIGVLEINMRKGLRALAALAFAYGASVMTIDGAAGETGGPAARNSAQFDALLAAHNWNGLAAALSQTTQAAQVLQRMDWMQAKLNAGGGAMLGFFYARDLWSAGSALKEPDPMKDARVTAGMITLYTLVLIAIDGALCEDRSTPSHRTDQLLAQQREALAFLKAQSPELKARIVDVALALERQTAPLRKDDDFLCRDGLDQMLAGLTAGSQREVPTPPGQVGKTIEVAAPPGYQPKFLPAEKAAPIQAQARAELRANLLKLIE
jgi:hypothetical protein